MDLRRWVVSQFHHPRGWAGHLAGLVMATRPSNRARNAWTIEQLGLEPAERVLEIGYGPGLALQEASRRVPEGLLVGIDQSAVMLRQAERRNREALASGRMKLLLGRVEDLPADLGSFDAVFSVNVVQFWPDAPALLRQLAARLATGGRLATTYQPRHRGARPEDAGAMADRLRGWTVEAGLVDVRVERLDLRPLPAVCVLGRRPQGDQTHPRPQG